MSKRISNIKLEYKCSKCGIKLRDVTILRKIDGEWYCPLCIKKRKLAKSRILSAREILQL